MCPPRLVIPVSILLFLALVSIGAVLALAGRMAPVRKGSSAEFWSFGSGVDLSNAAARRSIMGGVYGPRDSWYIYYIQGFHGQYLYRLPRAEAVADYPEVIRRLEALPNPDNETGVVRRAYNVVQRNRSAIEQNPEAFLGLLREGYLEQLKGMGEDRYEYAISEEKSFAERWTHVERYWLNVVFECAFFIGLAVFALWPWLRGWGIFMRTVHLGLLPLLLFAPYYLGYAMWTFTSVGPSGGVLYPWVIVWFRGFPLWTPADEWVLNMLPKVLEPISQPTGPMLSCSGGRPLGPVAALLIGVGVAVIPWTVHALMKPASIPQPVTCFGITFRSRKWMYFAIVCLVVLAATALWDIIVFVRDDKGVDYYRERPLVLAALVASWLLASLLAVLVSRFRRRSHGKNER